MTSKSRPIGEEKRAEWSAGRARRVVLLVPLAIGLLAAAAVRAVLLPSYVLLGDLDQYARWAHHLATEPFGTAYRQDFSYMPVLVSVFGALGRLDPAFLTASDASDPMVRIALKIPALLGDAAIAAGLVTVLRAERRLAALAILGVLLVPVTWYLGAWWAQVDSVYVALCLWTAIAAISDRRWLFAVLLGLALMTKPQAVFLAAPFAGYAIGRWGLRRALPVGFVAVAVAGLTWLPFLADGGLAAYLHNLDYYQNGQYPFLSLRAWNPWWLLQSAIGGEKFVSDSGAILGPLTPRLLGIAMTCLAGLAVLMAVARAATPDRLFLGLAAMTLLAFGLMTSMHERYAYASLVFLAPLLGRRPIQLAWSLLAVAISLNVVSAAPPDPLGRLLPVDGIVGVAGSLAMIGATLIVVGQLFGGSRRRVVAATGPDPAGTPAAAT